MPKNKSKIEREKMNYLQGLFFLCVRIDKEIISINGREINGLRKVERGIKALAQKLTPFVKDKKKIGWPSGNVSNAKDWDAYLEGILEVYGELHNIMDSQNLLLKEQEEIDT